MSIDIAGVTAQFKDVMKASGFDSTLVDNMADNSVRIGCEMFWRDAVWTFSTKTDSFACTADPNPYTCPIDCDAILGLRLENLAVYKDIEIMPSHRFDNIFPYPTALSSTYPVAAKVEMQDGVLQIYLAPPPNSTYTVRRRYKMKYSATTFEKVVPQDHEPTIIAAILYQAQPTVIAGGFPARATAKQEYEERKLKSIQQDATVFRKVVDQYGESYQVNRPGTWQFALDYTGDFDV